MVAAALISLLPRRYRPHLVLMGAMWNQNSGIRDRVDRFILSFANRAIQRYIVQSREELTVFPETWHIDPGKVRYCHYFYTLIDSELEYEAYSDEIYIFAGGNAHRDYEPLLEAARRMPDHKFIVASRLHFPDVSSNVIIESVPHEQFVRLMIGASVVVTPIKSGLSRAAGQQTYLNAMRLGKVSIVNGNDIFGVREYIEHGKNGLIVDGTPEGYVAAFEWVFDPANRAAVEAMQLAAKQHVQDTFTYENHVACIVEIIDELLETA
jgi:glycosyltransferase involved in cell wall biosynthesis